MSPKRQSVSKKDTKLPLTNDTSSIIWLLVLYTLQGVPMGMSAVFPLLLKERGASYSDLAKYSLCSWPFAMKLLWAPIVDGTHFPGLGRRKSWLVPCQLGIAALLYYLSTVYDVLLEAKDIDQLTWIFFALYFLAATQDVAVDGWALTMLSKANVSLAGTCNSIGQSAGYFMAFSGFFGLAQLRWCSMQTFMQIWSGLFVIVTVLIMVLKRETESDGQEVGQLNKRDAASTTSVLSIYKQAISVIKLPPVVSLSVILLTSGLSFIDGVIGVRFQEAGVSPEVIALLATLSTPAQILLPWVIAKFCDCDAVPLTYYKKAYWWRIALQLVSVSTVFIAPMIVTLNKATSPSPMNTAIVTVFYGFILLLSLVLSGVSQVMFTAKLSLFAKVADPMIGGTYMTVLNTIANIGGHLSGQITYRLVDFTTTSEVDGFYVLVALATTYGVFWITRFAPTLTALERKKTSEWRLTKTSKRV